MTATNAESESKSNPRDRLLEAAAALAYRDGVGIGVEALCKAAGVSKRSMYQMFTSKDELLAASLERRAAARGGGLVPPADSPLPPRARILYVFERLQEQALLPEYKGCPYLAMQVELKDTEHPASIVGRRVKHDLEMFFRREAERGGATDPEFLGRQLILVFDGASARAGIRADDVQGLATAMVGALLDAAGVR
jgi:AcrR family transcriptional regulator